MEGRGRHIRHHLKMEYKPLPQPYSLSKGQLNILFPAWERCTTRVLHAFQERHWGCNARHPSLRIGMDESLCFWSLSMQVLNPSSYHIKMWKINTHMKLNIYFVAVSIYFADSITGYILKHTLLEMCSFLNAFYPKIPLCFREVQIKSMCLTIWTKQNSLLFLL